MKSDIEGEAAGAGSPYPSGLVPSSTNPSIHPGGVLSTVGVFDALATADKPTNGYVAAILASYVYQWVNDLKSVTPKFTTDFGAASVIVGTGFFNGYSANRDAVLNLVTAKLQATPSKRLWFTGHSLGGAYSVLFAARAQRTGIPVAGVYTFGSPRVGDGAFAAAYTNSLAGLGSRTYRYEVQGDVVTAIPSGFVPSPAVPTHVGRSRILYPCGRRRLLSAEEEYPQQTLDITGRAHDAAVSRREMGAAVGSMLNHGLLDKYAFYTLNCVMSAAERSFVPPLEVVMGYGK
ncbi:hypothetical protein HYH03_007989 [Edaphochlamys debaryana]|uniref:Fungal lipase-type domain-containing protein n=1 Tax=Edaphochlamys debaryana TaxID=47281 RepID=A0A836BZU8_9CHLO|nr:hypothetical protein HYH03_007989 [Edaphochlamys debaryana]|eukprot:KAG2493768.1 hypothetical protein HYH03_007989 [Edaphochlamys debaryana]